MTTSDADMLAPGPMRMSSGPSFMNENPRSGRSRCIELTPRSIRIASTAPSISSSSANRSRMCRKLDWTVLIASGPWFDDAASRPDVDAPLASAAAASSRGRAMECASGSTSNPTKVRSSGCWRMIAEACPPAPMVPST